MKNFTSQNGFTIIELVVVMVVIGILSAVALPRLFDLSGQARKSTIIYITKSLKTAAELGYSQWVAENQPSYITIGDTSFYTGTIGYPLNVTDPIAPANLAGAPSTTDCIDLWNALLKNPPLASDVVGCLTDNSCKFEVTVDVASCVFTDKSGNTISYSTNDGAVISSLDGTF